MKKIVPVCFLAVASLGIFAEEGQTGSVPASSPAPLLGQEQFLEYYGDNLVRERTRFPCGRTSEAWYEYGELVCKIWYTPDGVKDTERIWQYKEGKNWHAGNCFMYGGLCVYEIWCTETGEIEKELFTDYKAGKPARQIAFYEDGRKTVSLYENGNHVRDTDYDLHGIVTGEQIWENGHVASTYALYRYEDGRTCDVWDWFDGRERMVWTAPDGSRTERFFENGSCTHLIESDAYGNRWEQFNSENGWITRTRSDYADGNRAERLYAGNACIYRVLTDADGRKREEQFMDDRLFSRTDFDAAGNERQFGADSNSIFDCTLSVRNGTVNGVTSRADRDAIKDCLPFFTGETEDGSESNFGGGVFYTDIDLYFYSFRHIINIRESYSGKIDVPVFGKPVQELARVLGVKPVKVESRDFGSLWECAMPYGFLYLAEEDDRCTELYMTESPLAVH